MKKFLLIALTSLALTGCHYNTAISHETERINSIPFSVYTIDDNNWYYVDNYTKVVYWLHVDDVGTKNATAAMTPLLHADGTPYLIDELR